MNTQQQVCRLKDWATQAACLLGLQRLLNPVKSLIPIFCFNKTNVWIFLENDTLRI
jgi:hypothetical protein